MNSTAHSATALCRELAHYPLKILPKGMIIRILRGELRGRKWIVGSQRHAFWLGIYEPHIQKAVAKEVKQSSVFYDVGANVGFYTLLSAMRVGPGKVFAFEPLAENVYFLKKHLDMNGIKNAEIFQVAISNQIGFSPFYMEETRAMGRLEQGGSCRVETTTLDFLIHKGRIAPPDYIKMDIEGAEFMALMGAKECFEKYKPKLFLATHGREVHEKCCGLLRQWKFDILPLGKPQADRAEIFASPSVGS